MYRSARDRARWLAELAQALDVASTSLAELADSTRPGSEAAALEDRIARVIDEVEMLRRGRNWPIETPFDPDWSKFPRDRRD